MAIARRGEDSSSQSDRLILRITEGGAAGEVAQIDLSDGSSFFVPFDTLPPTLPPVGEALDEAAYEGLVYASESFAARRKALDLLASREQTRARLELKLEHRGFSPRSIASALGELEASGRLDDRRFSEVWLAGRLRRNPEGRAKLLSGLIAQGVSREVAAEALQDLAPEDEGDALRRAAERLAARSDMSPRKMMRTLMRKGFPYRAALKEVFRLYDLSVENDLRELYDDFSGLE